MELPVKYRTLIASDTNFIFNSWIKSCLDSPHYKYVPRASLTSELHKHIEGCLLNKHTIVVTNREDSELYGYIVFDYVDDVFVLHYAYIKKVFRGLGLFKALLEQAGYDTESAGFYTHLTKNSSYVAEKVNLIYNPFILINYK